MKRINIKANTVGLVYKNEEFKRVLTAGKYWLGFGETVKIYNQSEAFTDLENIDILMLDAHFASLVYLIDVSDNQVVLVYEKGHFKNILTNGRAVFWIGVNAYAFVAADLNKMVTGDLDVLLQHETFRNLAHLVEVKDNELTLVYQNGNFKQVLTAGRYAFWIGVNNYSFVKADISKYEITEAIDRNTLIQTALQPYVRTFRIENHEAALLMVDGKLERHLAAGIYQWWNNSTAIQVFRTDLRLQNMDITGQEILTRDKAQLRINFSLQYKVTDAVKVLLENKEYDKQLYVLIQLGLREFVGRLTFDELMESKEQLATHVLSVSAEKAAAMGITLVTCGVKDIILPGDIKEIMNQVLVAEKRAQANLIMRREETASTRSLLNTAKLMEENSMLFKLKEMEYVEKIAEKINNISLSGSGQMIDQLKQIFVKS